MKNDNWQAREKHHNEVQDVFKRLGFLNGRDEISRYDGAKFWPEMETLGHSSTRFEDCACRSHHLSART